MSILRIRAAEVLAAIIEAQIQELSGKVCAGPSGTNHKRSLPSVAIVPIAFEYTPDQEEIWADLGETQAVINVGRYDALFQLQLGSKNPRTRARLEQEITELFFQREGAPGVLVAEIADCHDALIGYEMGEQSWRDEAGFGDKWFSITELNVVMPLLITRGSVHTIDEIRLCLKADVSATFAAIDSVASECVAVDEAGNVTVSVPPA